MAGVKCNWIWVDGTDIVPEEQSNIYIFFWIFRSPPVWTFMAAKEVFRMGSMWMFFRVFPVQKNRRHQVFNLGVAYTWRLEK